MDDKQTIMAYTKFLAGMGKEQDFLEFVFNSEELPQQLIGDCDCHNSVFALLCRYSGIPSRIVSTHAASGMPHAVTEVFLPGVGWIGKDSTVPTRSTAPRTGSDLNRTMLDNIETMCRQND